MNQSRDITIKNEEVIEPEYENNLLIFERPSVIARLEAEAEAESMPLDAGNPHVNSTITDILPIPADILNLQCVMQQVVQRFLYAESQKRENKLEGHSLNIEFLELLKRFLLL